jgi:hypothetical protein
MPLFDHVSVTSVVTRSVTRIDRRKWKRAVRDARAVVSIIYLVEVYRETVAELG